MQIAADLHLENAECPVWNPVDHRLYFAEIPRGLLFRLNPETMQTEQVHQAGEQIGALLVAEDGSLVLGLEEGRVRRWKDGVSTELCAGIPEQAGTRFNDGIVDPNGRMLLGTMPDPHGEAKVYEISPARQWRVVLDGLGQSNGVDFSLDGRTLYATDTKARVILAFDYDAAAGSAQGARVLARVDIEGAVPDGLEVDSQGRIWSAMWGGGCVVCFDAQGTELFRRELPTEKVSSLAFGGEKLDQMFVTTAGGDADRRGHAGAVFWEEAAVKGRAATLARVS